MAGSGSPILTVDGTGRRIAVVASSWHDVIMAALVDNAVSTLEDAGAAATVVRVPGTFELPVACRQLADHFDGLVALGVVIRGGTPHFDYVCAGATQGIIDVMTRTGTPIGFGVLTCDTEQQALARAGLPDSPENKGREAAEAVLATLTAFDAIRT
ncbi:6,7-dimethyl-8-ribityllumazine synthase [Brooklawnia propionicigenes]|uniref:6,7-dimethyl-8-ribityllumazine synthase n=2 Tax=Brooklawnia propionicigenes TaxID=3041175 RepID=A0AAN0K6L5_9ACTN|nr:6,7-dimethyl-8-ribityllumazine synthase [Brooklawnia sp. SH051]BEH02035.1 6,7-dimethyl-8-ribityllumazine synthase [Brooklawnia sp. SH051]